MTSLQQKQKLIGASLWSFDIQAARETRDFFDSHEHVDVFAKRLSVYWEKTSFVWSSGGWRDKDENELVASSSVFRSLVKAGEGLLSVGGAAELPVGKWAALMAGSMELRKKQVVAELEGDYADAMIYLLHRPAGESVQDIVHSDGSFDQKTEFSINMALEGPVISMRERGHDEFVPVRPWYSVVVDCPKYFPTPDKAPIVYRGATHSRLLTPHGAFLLPRRMPDFTCKVEDDAADWHDWSHVGANLCPQVATGECLLWGADLAPIKMSYAARDPHTVVMTHPRLPQQVVSLSQAKDLFARRLSCSELFGDVQTDELALPAACVAGAYLPHAQKDQH